MNRLLVVGAGRGGTSLLTALLDSHSLVTMGFEFGARQYLVEPEELPLANRLAALRAECDVRAARFSTPVWGNKFTTGQIALLYDGRPPTELEKPDDLVLEHFFLKTFVDWGVVFITREGTACIDSKRRRDGLDEAEAAERWVYSIQCLRFLQQRHPMLHVVRFEDLVHSPEVVLPGVCGFLGIGYEPDMLSGTENPKMRAEYRRSGFDRAVVAPVPVSAGVAQRIAPAMAMAGYRAAAS